MKKTSLTEQLIARFTEQKLTAPAILTDCCSGADAELYEQRRQIFNTKFQFRPQAIFLVENKEQVGAIVAFANANPTQITLRARSGGHDHEGECSGTDTWVIDFVKMNSVTLDKVASKAQKRNVVAIGPGARFMHVKSEMDKMGLGIPHGTCETVCVAGYTMGGGWGPWTRRYGMGCERLIGATIVLGDGSIKTVRDTDPPRSAEARLLWALRGGGGFSYGIVTELVYDAFELPSQAHSFQVTFVDADGKPDRRAIDILKDWESVIAGDKHPDLIGTNLMITGSHLKPGQEPDPNAKLACTFNGYYAGSEQAVRDLVEKNFGRHYLPRLFVVPHVIASPKAKGGLMRTKKWHFHGWDRQPPLLNKAGLVPLRDIHVDPDIALETEGPAPHKITSRLANSKGWNNNSRKALICTLQSPLVAPPLPDESGKDNFGMQQYITIGAISGPYYHKRKNKKTDLGVAFPYTKRPFTLQFQAWWDQYLDAESKPLASEAVIQRETIENRPWVNRGEDWIEACRDADIPNTSGAFISFKDDSVKTGTYFAQSYDPLKAVKVDYSEDQNLLFQSRKTIL